MADTAEAYRRLGLERDSVAAWEDGLRTDTKPGSYEWWYFDAHLEDGAKVGSQLGCDPTLCVSPF
jgi:predicted secreted hydrolase